MLDIELKQYLREFLQGEMEESKKMTVIPQGALMVREDQTEDFLDRMWVFISKKEHEKSDS